MKEKPLFGKPKTKNRSLRQPGQTDCMGVLRGFDLMGKKTPISVDHCVVLKNY